MTRAFITLMFTATLVAGAAAQTTTPTWTARGFYMTKTLVTGSQTTTACSTGYHFASLWEIFNVSTLKYDTTQGLTTVDSGSGPPMAVAWVRTGSGYAGSITTGQANCKGWTSSAYTDHGSGVILDGVWLHQSSVTSINAPENPIQPWQPAIQQNGQSGSAPACNEQHYVWCVQN